MIPEKIVDVRALKLIFKLQNWKMGKRLAKKHGYDKAPELMLINKFSPPSLASLITLTFRN